MKNKRLLAGIAGMALAFGLMVAGCDNGSTDTPTTYTVTFDGGDGSGAPPAAQTVESGQSVTLPGKGSLVAPTGKEFDGWRGDGRTLAVGDSYTVTKDVVFLAQWKTAFVAVTGISGIPTTGTVGTVVVLNGTVTPATATNKTVVWSVTIPGAGVTAINGTSFTPAAAGTLTLTATIADGAAAGVPYTQDFPISVSAAAPSFNSSVNEDTANNAATLGLVGTTVSANPTEIVKAELTADKSKLKITSLKAGSATITVSDNANHTATIAVTVAADGSMNVSAPVKYVPANPLLGAWRQGTQDNITGLVYFTDYEIAYYAKSLSKAGNSINRVGPTITLTIPGVAGAQTYAYELQDGNSKLVIKDSYFKDTGNKPVDATFTRIEGTAADKENGVWYSDKPADPLHTLLIIRGNSDVYTSFGMAAQKNDVGNNNRNWIRTQYGYIDQNKLISWGDGSSNTDPYSFDPDNANLLTIKGLNQAAFTKTTL
jgi:hypothetical protein